MNDIMGWHGSNESERTNIKDLQQSQRDMGAKAPVLITNDISANSLMFAKNRGIALSWNKTAEICVGSGSDACMGASDFKRVYTLQIYCSGVPRLLPRVCIAEIERSRKGSNIKVDCWVHPTFTKCKIKANQPQPPSWGTHVRETGKMRRILEWTADPYDLR